MHALCKTLFFTTGTVGLLVLVFLWSALEYGFLKLNHLIDSFLSYKFAGLYLIDFILIPSTIELGQRIHLLKLVITTCIATGSVFLIVLSYLPRVSWQIRSLSMGISIPLFSLICLFWIVLLNGNEVIKSAEKSAIFGFTVIAYVIAVFALWYAIRVKPLRRTRNAVKQTQKPKVNLNPTASPKEASEQELDDSIDEEKASPVPPVENADQDDKENPSNLEVSAEVKTSEPGNEPAQTEEVVEEVVDEDPSIPADVSQDKQSKTELVDNGLAEDIPDTDQADTDVAAVNGEDDESTELEEAQEDSPIKEDLDPSANPEKKEGAKEL
jgi:hypothetical protein